MKLQLLQLEGPLLLLLVPPPSLHHMGGTEDTLSYARRLAYAEANRPGRPTDLPVVAG